MTFAEFKAAVLENLGPDAARSGTGVTGLDAFKNRAIVNAMVDLQRFIPALRLHNTNTYSTDTSGVTAEGRCTSFRLPVGAVEEIWIERSSFVISDALFDPGLAGIFGQSPNGTYLQTGRLNGRPSYHRNGDTSDIPVEYRTGTPNGWFIADASDESNSSGQIWEVTGVTWAGLIDGKATITRNTCERHRLKFYPWAKRQKMICGEIPDGDYLYAIAPDNRTCLLHPGLTEATNAEVVWSGLKLLWANEDNLDGNWDQAVEAVAEYAKFRIVRNYDKDAVARSQRHEADYYRLRLALHRELKQ